jgi:hypothetical protein
VITHRGANITLLGSHLRDSTSWMSGSRARISNDLLKPASCRRFTAWESRESPKSNFTTCMRHLHPTRNSRRLIANRWFGASFLEMHGWAFDVEARANKQYAHQWVMALRIWKGGPATSTFETW